MCLQAYGVRKADVFKIVNYKYLFFLYSAEVICKNEQKPTKKRSFMIKTLYVYIYVPNSWADGQTIP